MARDPEDQKEDLNKLDAEAKKGITEEKAEDVNPIAFSNLSSEEYLMKKEAAEKFLQGKFSKYESWRKNWEPTWDEIYRLYINHISYGTKTPTRSKITVPVIFQVIETALPKIVNVIFTQESSFFEVIPENPDDMDKAESIQMLLEYQLRQADFFSKFIDFAKQLLLYGTSYFKVYWKVKRDWVWTRSPIRMKDRILAFVLGSKLKWEEKKEYKVVERRPEVEVLDILDVFPDPEARNEKDSMGLFIRSWMDMDEFKAMGKGRFPIYANTDDANIQADKYSYSTSRQMRTSVRGNTGSGMSSGDQVELLEYWGRYDVDGDGIKEEALLVIANRKVLVKAISNPFHHQKRPLIRTVLYPVPMEWYGIGLVEPVISLKHELDTLRRQRLDNINQALNRMWKVNSLADVDLETLISAPGNIVLTDDMNAVEDLEQNDVTQSNYQEAALVQSDIENVTTPRSTQGIPESGRLGRTAKGAQLIIGQALEKFGLSNKLIEEMGIKRVVRMFHQLDLQFIDSEDVFRDPGIYGHLFEQMLPEDIRAEVQFKLIGISEMVGTEGKINQAISFMGIFGKVLAPTTIQAIAQKVWKLMGFNPRDIEIVGLAAPSVQTIAGNVVDENLSQAVNGQAQNQGASAAPPATPNQPKPNTGGQ